MKVTSCKTRGLNSWDTCTKGLLRSGKLVNLPWSSSTQTTIPQEVRTDIKEQDGWKILYSTIDIDGYNENVTIADQEVNYLLFYNIYTGILKGFYYAESMTDNNCGLWQLSTSNQTKMFNFVPYFAEPINSASSPQKVTLSTISMNGVTQGFERGWNCFMLEIAYDEGSRNNQFNISGYALNQASITFTGAYNSNSSGTIVSTTQNKSNIIDGLASGSGAAAKQWIADNTTTDDNKNKAIKYGGIVIGEVLNKGISGIISTGLYKVFGSLLGKTNTTTNLQFSTNGKVVLNGKMVTPSSGFISPISGVPLNSLGYDLGVWNLEVTPTYTAKSYAELAKIKDESSGSDFYYYVTFTPDISLKKNPAVDVNVTSSVDVVRYDLYNGKVPHFYQDYLLFGAYQSAYRDKFPAELYCDSLTIIKQSSNFYTVAARNLLPNRTSTSNVPAVEFESSGVNIRENIVFKILTEVYTPDHKIYSTKSFIPHHQFNNIQTARPYQWTYKELVNLGYRK